MAARLAPALIDLRAEVDARWPRRDKRSDGWIGDSAHAARKSDHNPDGAGYVRAIDVDVDGIDAAWLVEHLRQLGAAGDRRLRGGYLILNGRIAGTHTGWRWRAYGGSNPHRTHAHVSAGDARADYSRRAPWGVRPGAAPKAPAPSSTPAAPPTPKDDPMARLIKSKDNPAVYGTDGAGHRWHVPSTTVLGDLRRSGIYGDGAITVVSQATIDSLKLVTR